MGVIMETKYPFEGQVASMLNLIEEKLKTTYQRKIDSLIQLYEAEQLRNKAIVTTFDALNLQVEAQRKFIMFLEKQKESILAKVESYESLTVGLGTEIESLNALIDSKDDVIEILLSGRMPSTDKLRAMIQKGQKPKSH